MTRAVIGTSGSIRARLDELDADHQTLAANLTDVGYLVGEVIDAVLELLADLVGVRLQIVFDEILEIGERRDVDSGLPPKVEIELAAMQSMISPVATTPAIASPLPRPLAKVRDVGVTSWAW